MTDNEIIKALECCTVAGEYVCYESKCPLFGKGHCIRELSTDALAIINRQKAEIEALIAGQETLQKHMNAETERLQNTIMAMVNYLDILGVDKTDTSFSKEAYELNAQIRADVKAEAVKEFAERLTFEIVNKPSEFKAVQATADYLSGSSHRQIEILDIIEEIVGDKNG